MVGPLKGGTHNQKYLLVMVDKFTKWVEAKPVKTAESGPVIDFISGVVHRYGVPHSIITDNGTNFTANEVKLWCKNMGIKLLRLRLSPPNKWSSRTSKWSYYERH